MRSSPYFRYYNAIERLKTYGTLYLHKHSEKYIDKLSAYHRAVVNNLTDKETILKLEEAAYSALPPHSEQSHCREIFGGRLASASTHTAGSLIILNVGYDGVQGHSLDCTMWGCKDSSFIIKLQNFYSFLCFIIEEVIRKFQQQYMTCLRVPRILCLPELERRRSYGGTRFLFAFDGWFPNSSTEFATVIGIFRTICSAGQLLPPTGSLSNEELSTLVDCIVKRFFKLDLEWLLDLKPVLDRKKLEVKFDNSQNMILETGHPYTGCNGALHAALNDSTPWNKKANFRFSLLGMLAYLYLDHFPGPFSDYGRDLKSSLKDALSTGLVASKLYKPQDVCCIEYRPFFYDQWHRNIRFLGGYNPPVNISSDDLNKLDEAGDKLHRLALAKIKKALTKLSPKDIRCLYNEARSTNDSKLIELQHSANIPYGSLASSNYMKLAGITHAILLLDQLAAELKFYTRFFPSVYIKDQDNSRSLLDYVIRMNFRFFLRSIVKMKKGLRGLQKEDGIITRDHEADPAPYSFRCNSPFWNELCLPIPDDLIGTHLGFKGHQALLFNRFMTFNFFYSMFHYGLEQEVVLIPEV